MEFSDLARLASGHTEARIVQAAVELGIFDAIGGKVIAARAVADTLHLEPRATELMLNALAALDLVRKQQDRFALTDASSRYLIRNSAEYLGGMILFEASHWRCWERLVEALRSGKAVRPANMYQEDSTETEIFIQAMDSLVKARGDAEIVAQSLDWTDSTELLDIGTGPATYPIALCRKYPKLHATLFDLPATLTLTRRYVREAGLGERIQLITGDYRSDAIPGSYDVIFLSNIIHGEDFAANQQLIKKLSANLNPGGRLVLKDHILDDTRTAPPVGAIFSLLMLLTTEAGRCYGFDEVKTWLEAAGLKHIRQIDLPPPLTSSLVIAEN